MNQVEINCPYCHAPGQIAVVTSDYHGIWTSCNKCFRRMHMSGCFRKLTHDEIWKTVDGMAQIAEMYAKGEAS